MAQVIITLQIMPTSPEVDMDKLFENITGLIKAYSGETEIRRKDEPIAFGLKAQKITFVADESKGTTEALETQIAGVEDVESVQVVDVRRAIG